MNFDCRNLRKCLREQKVTEPEDTTTRRITRYCQSGAGNPSSITITRREQAREVYMNSGDTGADMADPNSDHTPNASNLPSILGAQEGRIIKKRNRIPVSCAPCRTRRSKCDRSHPCGACEKRGEGHLCNYAKPAEKHPKGVDSDGRRNASHGAQDRLSQLEELVTQLMSKDQPGSTGDAPYQEAGPSAGYQQLGENGYSAAVPEATLPHWTAVLNGIQEIKASLQNEDTASDAPDGILDLEDRPVLLAAPRPASLSSILNGYLPSQNDCNSMLQKYFRTPYMTMPILHSGQFEDQYRQFWVSPPSADPIWCGLLFAILSLAAHIINTTGTSPGENYHPTNRFAHAAALCLNLAGYSRPRPSLIPALLILAQAIYMQNYDPSREVSLILSLVSRLAFQSQLNRNPSPALSFFEQEMHRRTWSVVRHFELQCACQFGIPTSIPFNSYDVREPHNLYDTDFGEDTTEAPTPRPETESTHTLTFILKQRLMNVFAEVYFYASGVRPPSDSDFRRLDSEIRRQRDNLPDQYKSRPLESSFTVEQHVIMARVTCELLIQKSICLLHRQRMAQGSPESTKACMDAASAIVDRMTNFADGLKPGGPIEGQPWMISSTQVNDFLLGASMLCAGLIMKRNKRGADKSKDFDEIVRLLRKGRQLCLDLGMRSRGAKRIGDGIGAALARAGIDRDENVDPSLSTGPTATSPPLPTPQSGPQYPVATGPLQQPYNITMPMSNDAMSSLAAAAAQLSPEGGFAPPPNKPGLAQQNYSPAGYSWGQSAMPAQGSQQYQGSMQMPTPDPFQQFFDGIGQGQVQDVDGGGKVDIDWMALDQFITSGDGMGWDSSV